METTVSQRRLILRSFQSPGDIVMLSAAIRDLHACVDHVLIFDDETPHELLRSIRPDVLVKGGSTANVIAREVVEAYGGQIVVTGLIPGVSTTALVERTSLRSAAAESRSTLDVA